MSMPNFVPHEISTPYHFEIAQNKRGYWVAKDDRGLIGGVFRSRKDALKLRATAPEFECFRRIVPGRCAIRRRHQQQGSTLTRR
jgi:hypothetical protein